MDGFIDVIVADVVELYTVLGEIGGAIILVCVVLLGMRWVKAELLNR